MSKELIVTSTSLETKLAILEDDQVTEIFIERAKNRGILGNIYKGKVTRVLPGMQAAFVDIGLERHAFLYVADFLEEYEEYEELFRSAEDADEGVPFDSSTNGRRGRRGRRGGRRRRGEKAARSESAPREQPARESKGRSRRGESRVKKPALEPAVYQDPLAASSGQKILPEKLELNESHPVRKREKRPPRGGILPDKLDGSPAASKSDGDDRSASHSAPPDVATFATRPETRRRSRGVNHQALIGDLLREGQEILVQVAKEPIGRKGARITSHVAIPGRYVVFMPTVDHVGVSRKIASDRERARLREIVMKVRGDYSKGFIVRTVGEGRDEQGFTDDMRYLTCLWEGIRVKYEKSSAPALIHAEPGLLRRVIRDFVNEEFRAIRVDDEQEYARIVEFVSTFNPELVKRVRLFHGRKAIFDEYGINAEIEKALKHKVWLKNGGHIVINQTEALVAIDVNTGKFVGRTDSLEETITRTNLGAVREVVRQIRLRDLGGIIIIDFIDMDESRNRQKVMEALQNELAKDKSPSKILRFNEFGLVAITRKRVKQSLEKALCQPCVYCTGTGMTKSLRTIAYSIHQEVRRMVGSLGEGQELLLRCHPDIARGLRETEREVLKEIEEMTHKTVSLKPDPMMHIEKFDLIEL